MTAEHTAVGLRGKIVMIKTNRQDVGMALKALGHPSDSQDKAALSEAETLIEAQRARAGLHLASRLPTIPHWSREMSGHPCCTTEMP